MTATQERLDFLDGHHCLLVATTLARRLIGIEVNCGVCHTPMIKHASWGFAPVLKTKADVTKGSKQTPITPEKDLSPPH